MPNRRCEQLAGSRAARQGRAARRDRVVGARPGRVPHRHHRVADVLVHRSAGLVDAGGHRRKVVTEQACQSIGLDGLGQGGEAAHVGEQQRDVFEPAAEHGLAVGGVQVADQIDGHVLAHRAHRSLGLLHTLEHVGHVAE
jgi:hypothetical protein